MLMMLNYSTQTFNFLLVIKLDAAITSILVEVCALLTVHYNYSTSVSYHRSLVVESGTAMHL